MPSGQVVDTSAATEFMSEVLARTSEEDLVAICGRLEAKARGFASLLADGRAATAGRDDLRRVLRSIFTARRQADAILDTVGHEALGQAIARLLDPSRDLPERIEQLDELLSGFPKPRFDLPGEILHFTNPERYWLWSRWMWDPDNETGSLRLVTMDEYDLVGGGRGETYLRVGQAIAFVNETGKAVGFTSAGKGLFGVDVFLACVYAVYMYTVLRMRMTQEFNKVVPELPELVSRLLGVHRMEV